METERVVSNASWIIGCKIIKAILVMVVTMVTSRLLGPFNYGVINYASSLTTFATSIAFLGINAILVYEFAQKKYTDGEILGTTVVMCMLSSIICIIGIVCFTLVANPGEKQTTLVCFIYSTILLFQVLEMVQYWFQYKLISKYVSICMTGAYFILLVVQFIVLFTKQSIYVFAISYSIEYALIAVFLIIFYFRFGGSKFSFSKEVAKELFSKSKYYIIAGMMVTIFQQTDKVMLKIMIGETATGYYSAAVTCASMFSFVFAAIIDSFRPLVFERYKNGEEELNSTLVNLYSVVIYSSLVVSFIMCLCPRLIIRIMCGVAYYPAISALQIVVWFTTFSYLGTIRDIWMLAKNKQKYIWIINLFGAIANIVLNMVLIRWNGIVGAAIASLITQFFTNVIVGFIFSPVKPNNMLMIKGINPKYFVTSASLVAGLMKKKFGLQK